MATTPELQHRSGRRSSGRISSTPYPLGKSPIMPSPHKGVLHTCRQGLLSQRGGDSTLSHLWLCPLYTKGQWERKWGSEWGLLGVREEGG
jgi:hypothetical protein